MKIALARFAIPSWSLSISSLLPLLLLIAVVEAKSKIEFPSGWDDSTIDLIKEGGSAKTTIAIMGIDSNTQLDRSVQLNLSDMMTTALAQTNRFEIVEREKLESIIAEQNLGLSGILDESTAAEVGNLSGAQYLVLGSITSATKNKKDKFGYILVEVKVGVDVRVVSASTGKILKSGSALGVASSKEIRTVDGVLVQGAMDDAAAYEAAARDAVNKVSAKISDFSPLVGFVVDVDKKKITIDVGEEKGVQKGDTFIIFRIQDEIKHPVTGKRLGWKKEILSKLKISQTERTLSIGKVYKKQSKQDIIPGDFVISGH